MVLMNTYIFFFYSQTSMLSAQRVWLAEVYLEKVS